MKTFLRALFLGVLVSMIAVTTKASLDRNVLVAGKELLADPWGLATLCDAYFGFTTFFVWVAYKENSLLAKIIWFALIMVLGNIAMSVYMLIQLSKLKPGQKLDALLLNKP